MSRYDDQKELLDEVEQGILKLSGEYHSAKTNDELLRVSRPIVKSCFEHVRSIFDYAAMDIYESYSRKETKIYFPYGEDERQFIKRVKVCLPGLPEQAPDLLRLVESVQPHRCGSNWLSAFCKTNNFNKHNRLSPQKRSNSEGRVVEMKGLFRYEGSGELTIGEMILDGVPVIKKELKISRKHSFNELKGVLNEGFSMKCEFDNVEFRLVDVDYDIRSLLTIAHAEAHRLAAEVHAVIH